MSIKSIEITNFKCIGRRQLVEFRPITLLYGQNNAGKSTLFQAMHYMREILVRNNVDADFTIGGGRLDLGGFKSLVHKHEFNRSIVVKLVVKLTDELRRQYLPLNTGNSLEEDIFSELGVKYLVGEDIGFEEFGTVEEVGVELKISWSQLYQFPYVEKIGVEMNGERIVNITNVPSKNAIQFSAKSDMISKFQIEGLAHPLLNFAHPPLQ